MVSFIVCIFYHSRNYAKKRAQFVRNIYPTLQSCFYTTCNGSLTNKSSPLSSHLQICCCLLLVTWICFTQISCCVRGHFLPPYNDRNENSQGILMLLVQEVSSPHLLTYVVIEDSTDLGSHLASLNDLPL